MRWTRPLRLWLCLSALVLAGCSGSIEDGGGRPSDRDQAGRRAGAAASSAGSGSGGAAAPAEDHAEPEVVLEYRPAKFVCADPASRGRGPQRMRRLTRDELLDSISAVVGASVMGSDAVVRAAARIPEESPGDLVATFQNGHSFDHVEGILLMSQAVAAAVADDDKARDAVFGTCAANADRACAEAFLDTQRAAFAAPAARAARRASLLTAFESEGSGPVGHAVAARAHPASAGERVSSRVAAQRLRRRSASRTERVRVGRRSVFFAPNGGAQQGPQRSSARPAGTCGRSRGTRDRDDYAERRSRWRDAG